MEQSSSDGLSSETRDNPCSRPIPCAHSTPIKNSSEAIPVVGVFASSDLEPEIFDGSVNSSKYKF